MGVLDDIAAQHAELVKHFPSAYRSIEEEAQVRRAPDPISSREEADAYIDRLRGHVCHLEGELAELAGHTAVVLAEVALAYETSTPVLPHPDHDDDATEDSCSWCRVQAVLDGEDHDDLDAEADTPTPETPAPAGPPADGAGTAGPADPPSAGPATHPDEDPR